MNKLNSITKIIPMEGEITGEIDITNFKGELIPILYAVRSISNKNGDLVTISEINGKSLALKIYAGMDEAKNELLNAIFSKENSISKCRR